MKKKLNLNKGSFIPVSKPYVSKEDIKSINKVLKKSWISSDGPEVKTLEARFSKKVNRKYSIAVSNGTAALEIAIKSLGLKKGDEAVEVLSYLVMIVIVMMETIVMMIR